MNPTSAGPPRPARTIRAAARGKPRSVHPPQTAHPALSPRLLDAMGWIASLALLVACVGLALLAHPIGDNFTETDFYGGYAPGAELIQRGHWIPSRYQVIGPGYETALAVAGFVFRDLFLGAKMLSAVSAALTVLIWFWIIRQRLGGLAAGATVLLLVANPSFLRYGYAASSDAFAVALQAAALLLLLSRPGSAALLVAGTVSALALLTRYSAAYLFPLGLVAIAYGGDFAGRRLRSALIFGAAFAVPATAWWIYSAASGSAPGGQLHHMIAFEVYARQRGIIWDEYERDLEPHLRTWGEVLRYDPPALVAGLARNAWEHLRLDAERLLGLPVTAVVALGALFGCFDRGLRRAWPIALAWLLAYGLLVPARHGERYSLALLPMYLTVAGWAFGSRVLDLRVGARRWPLKPLLIAVPLAASLLASVRLQSQTAKSLPREVLAAVAHLKPLARPGDGVIARKPHLAYLSRLRSVPIPFAHNLKELADAARRGRARWLYFSYNESESRPDLYPLLDTTGVIRGLTPRWVSAGAPAVLYEMDAAFDQHAGWPQDTRLMNLRLARARLRLTPDDPQAMWLEAAMEVELGQWERSKATLERAVLLDPRSQASLEAVSARDSTRAMAGLSALLATLQRAGPASAAGAGE